MGSKKKRPVHSGSFVSWWSWGAMAALARGPRTLCSSQPRRACAAPRRATACASDADGLGPRRVAPRRADGWGGEIPSTRARKGSATSPGKEAAFLVGVEVRKRQVARCAGQPAKQNPICVGCGVALRPRSAAHPARPVLCVSLFHEEAVRSSRTSPRRHVRS